MNTHPLAALIPAMSTDEYARLRDDIAANGLLDPITLYDGQVLDGRHRLRACEETGVEPGFTSYKGFSPAQFVLSHNLHRRHLSASQRAIVATDFLPHLALEAKDRQGARNDLHKTCAEISAQVTPPKNRASSRAAEAVGISRQQVERAQRITREAPELVDQVRNGDLTVNAAYMKTRGNAPKSKPATNGRGRPLPVATREELPPRNAVVANKTRERIHGALATLDGLTAGLAGLHLVNLHLVTGTDEASHWHTQLAHAVDALRRFDRALKEAQL